MNRVFARENKENLDWCAFIDVDEFITFDKDYNLKKLLTEFNSYPGVYLFWKTYGAAGHIKKPKGIVRDAYCL